MSDNSEQRLISRTVILNSTISQVTVITDEDGDVVEYIRVFNALQLDWLKAIPDIAYGIGLLANLLLVIYLIKYKRYRSPIFALILSTCFADAMMCAIAIVWTTWRWPFLIGPEWMCPFGTEILIASIICSEYHLVVIAIVRFYQLVFPLSARAKVTSELMLKICIGVWFFSFISSIPFAILNGAIFVEYDENVYGICTWIGGRQMWGYLYLAIVNILAPFTITAAFHIAKHCIVMKAGAMTSNSLTIERQQRETTDSRAVMIVITVYLVTAAPVAIYNFMMLPAHPLVGDIISKIQWLNSALNPFIYAFAAQSVRRDILRMVCSGVIGKHI